MRPRRRTLFLAALALASCALLVATTSLLAGAPAPRRVGGTAIGRTSLESLGVARQSGNAFTIVGYLTHVTGLSDARLFTSATQRDEAHARFTFTANASVTGRSLLQNLFAITASGSTRIYFHASGGASFAAPASFARGTRIATFGMRLSDVLNVQAPNRGIATASEDLTQVQVAAFRLAGRRFRLGAVGMHLRLEGTGEGLRTSITPLASTTAFATVATVTG